MTKRPPTKQPKANLGTYFLAKQSKLFRPGAEFMLAAAKSPARRKAMKSRN